MPVDKSNPAKSNSAIRRSRGEIACAECRRLKSKCDKQIPCSSCVRRGCATICPNGSLTAGHGSRYILSDTEELHRKLITMSERIRGLEEALRAAFPAGHPLLSEDLLTVKHGVDASTNGSLAPPSVPSASSEPDDPIDVLDESLGTLVIGEGGSTLFIGTTGATANVLINEESTHTGPNPSKPSPTAIDYLSETWPFYPIPDSFDKASLLEQLLSHVPPKEKIFSLCEALFENLIWATRTITRSQFVEEVIPAVCGRTGSETSQNAVDFHELALLFMVCALGSVADLAQDPYNNGAFQYYTLARAAFSLKSTFADATLTTIQVLHLMNEYIHFLGVPKQQEVAWITYGMMEALAMNMGLHRDPSRWNLEQGLSERRRKIFWEIFWIDSWKSMTTGRPPYFSTAEIDCAFPSCSVPPSDLEEAEAFRLWLYKYATEILHPIAKRMTSIQPLKHSEVLEFDRKVREYQYYISPVPASPQDSPNTPFWHTAQRGAQALAMSYIHRPFFAKTMLRPNENPLDGPYAASFLRTFTHAISNLQNVRELFGLSPYIAVRCWFLWQHAVCSLVVISSVVALKPHLDIAPAGLAELALSAEMFENAVHHSEGLRTYLPTVLRLRSKAFEAYARNRNTTVPDHTSDFSKELAMLGGHTRSVYVKDASTKPGLSGRQTPADGSQTAPSNSITITSPSMFTNPSTALSSGAVLVDVPEAPPFYPIPNIRALNDDYVSSMMDEGPSTADGITTGIPQDTWNDLLRQTGVHPEDLEVDSGSDIEWSLPDTFQDWM